MLTREPGGTTIGELVRGVLLDPAHDAMVDRAEALLYAADRAQHLVEVVEPALAAGRHVVSDRSALSSVAYQGYGRGLGAEAVWRVNDWAIGGRWPDLVVLLDVRPVRDGDSAAAGARTAWSRSATASTSGCATATSPWPPPTAEALGRGRWQRRRGRRGGGRPRRRGGAAVNRAERRVGRREPVGRGRRPGAGRGPACEAAPATPGPRLPVRRAGGRRASGRRPGPSPRRSCAATAAAASAATAGSRWPASIPTSARWSGSGAAISKEQATEVIRLASLMPLEGARKVLILDEFHLIQPDVPPRLLKTIEEPEASTVFVILADDVPERAGDDRVALRARSTSLHSPSTSSKTSCWPQGVAADDARAAAAAAAGNLDRARVLALDHGLLARRDAFHRLPQRLDGTGAEVAKAVDELLGLIDAAADAPEAAPGRGDRRRSTVASSSSASEARAARSSSSATSGSCVATAPTS